MLALASLRGSLTTQSAVTSKCSARFAMAFAISAETLGFIRFSWPITAAVLAL